MARRTTSRKRELNLSIKELERKQKRLEWLKERLAGVIEEREYMRENWETLSFSGQGNQQRLIPQSRKESNFKHLNDRIAKLNFEIFLLEGGTIEDQATADYINKRWGYQNPYTNETRPFEVGDRFNLDYGENFEGADYIFDLKEGDINNPDTFAIERLQNKIEELQINPKDNIPDSVKDGTDRFIWVNSNSEIVEEGTVGAEQMLESDYLRSTNTDPYADYRAHSLQDKLRIRKNESLLDLTITNGTQ
tara:strand:- start:95 stop:841 length:747 start_codon:yes stop_codon:yes gene_type:complete